MVAFVKTIKETEIKSHYLNVGFLRESPFKVPFKKGEEYLLVNEQNKDKKTICNSHSRTQLTGLKSWFDENKIVSGEIICFSYDNTERINNKRVLHYKLFEKENVVDTNDIVQDVRINNKTAEKKAMCDKNLSEPKTGERSVLTKKEIAELIGLLQRMIKDIEYLKDKTPIATYIEKTKTPHILSESLVVHLINDKIILEDLNLKCKLGGGKKEPDIIGKMSGRYKVKIEVKSTISNFSFFSNKDVKADFLIWVDLKEVIVEGKENFGVYVVIPKDLAIRKGNINLEIFRNIINHEGGYFYYRNLFEYLRRPQ